MSNKRANRVNGPITVSDKDQVIDWHFRGYPNDEIAKLVGCSEEYVMRVLTEATLPENPFE